jgi:hypothetical protein
MAEIINKYKEIMEKLKREGKVKVLNSPDDLKAMDAMNESVKKTKEEYQVKDMNSQLAAAQVILR